MNDQLFKLRIFSMLCITVISLAVILGPCNAKKANAAFSSDTYEEQQEKQRICLEQLKKKQGQPDFLNRVCAFYLKPNNCKPAPYMIQAYINDLYNTCLEGLFANI